MPGTPGVHGPESTLPNGGKVSRRTRPSFTCEGGPSAAAGLEVAGIPGRWRPRGGGITRPKIFVGSSTEAVELARKVAGVVEEAGMIPAVWDTGTFPVGSTLLERIDGLAYEFDGAVLLFTPDTRSVRGGLTIAEPISNVMFEYGYLSARLTRQ